jgi:uncharacterized protein involved in exopolysaccharide biosynthesis
MTHEPGAAMQMKRYTARDFVTSFFRHKKKAFCFVASVAALATLVLLFAPRKYRSEARLFMQVGRESVRLDPTATTGKTIALQQSGRDNEIATAMEVLKSRAIAEQAVDELSPEVVLGESGDGRAEPNPVADFVMWPLRQAIGAIKSIDPISKREEAIIELTDGFAVDAEHDSTVIVLTYDGKSPVLAQRVLDAVVDAYAEQHVKLHRTSGSKGFFTEQYSELERQLIEAESKLREAKNAAGLASVEARRGTLETRLGSIEQVRNEAIQLSAASVARIEALTASTAAMPERLHTSTRTAPNSGADSLRSQLYGLQVKLMDLEAKYSAEHPQVVSTRAQVAEAKELVAAESPERQETVDSLNENHRALSLDLAQAESELAGIQARLAELDTQREITLSDLKQLNDLELEIDQLERNVSLANSNFFRYAEALEQARMDEELDNNRISNINVAQPPTLMEKPVSPSKLIVLALSMALAGAGTTALVVACDQFDSRVRDEQQVEQLLRIPVLTTVPDGRHYGAMPLAAAR